MKTENQRTNSGKRNCIGMTAAALLLAAFLLTGCPMDRDEDRASPVDWNPASLANAVYGGTNPGNAWVTITFRSDGKMIGAFSGDNTSNEWDYTCANGSGSITSSGWTPGAFTLAEDGKTLTFTNFGGHGGQNYLTASGTRTLRWRKARRILRPLPGTWPARCGAARLPPAATQAGSP